MDFFTILGPNICQYELWIFVMHFLLLFNINLITCEDWKWKTQNMVIDPNMHAAGRQIARYMNDAWKYRY